MRGILFTGGEGPEPEKSRRLARGAGLIVAADSGLLTAEAAGLRPDWVLGDMDSLGDPRRLETYPPERVLTYIREKDYTDTELAFSFLVEKGCDEIWLIGGGGGRIDHLFAIRSMFERELCPRGWISASGEIYSLTGPDKLAFSLRAGVLLSVFPLGAGPWEAESEGLKWPLNGLAWNRGFFGVSNEAETGGCSIRAAAGRFMIILPGENGPVSN
ncbi:MAG: thiamine diphosphokinase [Treponema sp.]|jgi:thiamine pyrophosphokinase|nr:thiamine diphosphokinase [Treponema sp.]